MNPQQNVSTQEKAAALLNSGDVDAFVDTLFAVDAVDHDPAPGQGPGREGYRTFFHTLSTAFPDAHLEPLVNVVDEDKIAFAYTLTGTHQGSSTALQRPVGGSRYEECRSVGSRTARSSSGGGAPTNSASCSRSARLQAARRAWSTR
ncbi:ester cyclase [Blastococcus brunescens]|uniref:Ester cyclase n=1 Tax=Blastococcus brunescens TaxID=1564165 RepID=A0ABZ1B6W5_9ACTN|nr:ester cyclase [Blastococcus sp. BMG 8361]WRL66553.1 ester cyclase [Blastococcus sp. BMG 8361]